MQYSVDVSGEYQKAKSKNLRFSLLFSFILTVTLVCDTLLVILTKEDYIISFIIASVVTVLFCWFAIFFFSVLFRDINARYRFFKSYDGGLKPIEQVEFIKVIDELTYVNGLYVYPIYVRCINGMEAKEKIIYSFKKDFVFKEGDKFTIMTYQRILMKAGWGK